MKKYTNQLLSRDKKILIPDLLENCLHAAENEASQFTEKSREAYFLGVRSAPLIIGFVLYIAEKVLIDKIEKLFFFTREGEFFIRIWRTIFPDNYLADLRMPEVSLLEVSRIATFCASLREINTSEMMRIWNLYSTQSIFALIKTLDLEPDDFINICASHRLSLTEDIVFPWRDSRVQALFEDKKFLLLVQQKRNANYELLKSYLNQKGLGTELRKIGCVDIGWRGTIQDNISYVLPHVEMYGYYLGLQRFLNLQPENCIKSAFGPNVNDKEDLLGLLDNVSLIEMLCNSPGGSVTGYNKMTDGLVVAQRIIDKDENAVHYSFVSSFQEGVIFAAKKWADYIVSNNISSNDLREHSLRVWKSFIDGSNKDLKNAYLLLSHNETFGLGKFVDKNEKIPLKKFYAALSSKKDRREIGNYLLQFQSTSEIWSRKEFEIVYKVILLCAKKFAVSYKYIKRVNAVKYFKK